MLDKFWIADWGQVLLSRTSDADKDSWPLVPVGCFEAACRSGYKTIGKGGLTTELKIFISLLNGRQYQLV